MLIKLKRIIKRMLDFYKRNWMKFLGLFVALLLGAVQVVVWLNDQWYMPLMAISLSILALICLIIGLIGMRLDILDACKKDRESKKDATRKALCESVKRMNPEYTEKQLDIWMHDL